MPTPKKPAKGSQQSRVKGAPKPRRIRKSQVTRNESKYAGQPWKTQLLNNPVVKAKAKQRKDGGTDYILTGKKDIYYANNSEILFKILAKLPPENIRVKFDIQNDNGRFLKKHKKYNGSQVVGVQDASDLYDQFWLDCTNYLNKVLKKSEKYFLLWIEEAGKDVLDVNDLADVKEINEKIASLKSKNEVLRNSKRYKEAKNYVYRQSKNDTAQTLRLELYGLQDEFAEKSLSTKLITKGEARRFIRGVGALEKQIEKAEKRIIAKRNIIEKQETSIAKVKNKIDDLEKEITTIKIPNAGSYNNLLYVVSFPL